MRVDLPVSGGWVEVAERWKATLHGQVTGAVMIRTADGEVFVPGDIGDRQTLAFLVAQITDWSFAGQGIPIPKAHGEKGIDVLQDVLEGNEEADDFAVLKDAVQPLLLKIVGSGRGNSKSTPKPLPASSPSFAAEANRAGSS